ncbi:MAG: carbohydrate binding family 9 domain-containing protein [Bryobacterales bacterium]|nr:carbohydrate binding family 9 domain-containing protein [Bryobacterales bacterium]
MTRNTLRLLTHVLCLLPFSLVLPGLHAGDARRAVAIQISEPIRLDGVLDEAVWAENSPIGEFIQVEPRTGEPPTEPTKAWIAYTKEALYVAVRCEDSHPGRIVARELLRDSFLFSDDNVELVLDTFHDQRNAYYFATNPAGVMVDGRVTENRYPNREWDGIWMVRVSTDAQGWSAEFEIPFKTLGFDGGKTSWGFNISRHLGRAREFSRWATPSLDVRLTQMARAGAITSLEGLSQGVGLDVRPYAIGGWTRDREAARLTRWAGDAGADIFYRITSNLISSTTINTDFAETEVDARQVNLTRYSLFFPERRTFFLEDAGVFDFAGGQSGFGRGGQGGGGMRRRNVDLLPFFSRRIGLTEDEDGNTYEVPIRIGQKLTGKAGRFDLGLMGVRTGDTEIVNGQSLAVGRVKANFWRQSYVGALFTNGNPEGGASNHLEGIDLRLATSNFLNRGKSFIFSLYGSRTRTAGLKGKDAAYGFEFVYPNDFLSADFRNLTIGENYNPALGFVPRTGVRINSSRLEFGPRPRFWGIRQLTFGVTYQDYYDLVNHGSETTRIQVTPLELQFNSGDRIQYSWNPNFEQLFEPFEIRDDVSIPVGRYWTGMHRINAFTSGSRPFSVRLDLETGGFYSGTRKQAGVDLSWRKNSHLSTTVNVEQNWVRLKEGSFNARLFGYRLDYSFTPLISLSSFIQYDSDSENIGMQSRLRWILKPGNEFYVVINHAWQEDMFNRFVNYQTKARVKLNYTFRF